MVIFSIWAPAGIGCPGVFEKFFNDFGLKTADLYSLKNLDPGFSIVFGNSGVMDIPADFDALCALFEEIEPGSSEKN